MSGWTHLRLDRSGTSARPVDGAAPTRADETGATGQGRGGPDADDAPGPDGPAAATGPDRGASGPLSIRLPPLALTDLRREILRDGASRPACLRVEAFPAETERPGDPERGVAGDEAKGGAADRPAGPGSPRWLQGAYVAAEARGGPPGELDFVGVDITSLRRELLAARETADRFRGLVTHATDVISTVTADGRITYANPAAERVLGVPPEELVGESMFDRIHPDDRAEVAEAVEEAVRHPGEARKVRIRVRHADGRWIRVEAHGINPAGGETDEIVVVSSDVTERWEAERALEQALGKYNTFFELIPVGVVLSDPETGAMYEVNDRFREIFGHDEDEILGRTSLELGMWEDRDRRSELVEQVVEGEGFRGEEAWFRTKDGERRRMMLSCRRLDLAGRDRLLWAVDDITEMRRREERLHLQRDALEATDHAIVITDREGIIEWVNPAFTRMTGYALEEAVGREPSLLRSGEQDDAFYEAFWDTILSGDTWTGEIVNRRKSGELYTEWMSVVPVRHESDEITHFIALKRDVTERRARERALIRSEERYRSLFEDSVDPVILTTPEGDFLDVNAAFEEHFGYGAAELERMSVADLYAEPGDRTAFLEALRARGVVRDLELKLRTRSGENRVCRISARTHRDAEGEVDYIQGVLHDVTELKRMEDRLRHRALHDPLTDVANRDLLRERIQGALARSGRSGEALAVAVVDLNRFKRVNDSLGHAAGDRVLEEVAARLRQALREEDTVARIGGDEFALLLEGPEGELAVRAALERVLRALRRPYEVEGESVRLEQAVGVALYRPEGELAVQEPEDLIRYADLAMYRVKEDETSGIAFFRPRTDHERMTVVRREHELREAVEAGQLVPHYQPIVELASGRIVGFEALARWKHPEGGLLSPDAFLPLAEESGLIVPLGYAVCERAFAALAAWSRNRAPEDGSLSIFVNLSVRQLAEDEIADRLAGLAASHGVEAGDVTLEITETGLMRGRGQADRLAARGFRLAIDDFGTGYASLAYLKLMDVDVLKVDRSFVAGLGQDPADSAIVETVLTLGRSLEIDVLAEGIETDYQAGRLRDLGCRLGQGYHLGRPVSGDEVTEVLVGKGGSGGSPTG